MASLDVLLAFVVATSLFAFMPGPAMIYVAAQTLARGRKAGWMATLGVATGGLVHVAAAAAGLSALFAFVPEAYAALKIAGAAYLIWLGVSLIRAPVVAAGPPSAEPVKGAGRSGVRAFVDSIIVEVLNPKTAIFFIAFLPQFVDPAAALPVWAQFLALGLVVNLFFAAGDVVAVLGAAFVMGRIGASAVAQRVIKWLGGSLLVGLGVKLATDRS